MFYLDEAVGSPIGRPFKSPLVVMKYKPIPK